MKQVVYKNLKNIATESTSHTIGSKGEFVDDHSHPTMEEFYCFTKGKAKLTIDKMEHFCKKDTFIKIPKNSVHSLRAITSIDFIYWGIAI